MQSVLDTPEYSVPINKFEYNIKMDILEIGSENTNSER
jgi:hypothetical protein